MIRFMRKMIAKILPHISIVISGMMIVFFIIDRYNKKMRFMEDEMTKVLIFILGISAIGTAIMLIHHQRSQEWQHLRRNDASSDNPATPGEAISKLRDSISR